jgi:hypothetical protein
MTAVKAARQALAQNPQDADTERLLQQAKDKLRKERDALSQEPD